MVKANGEPPPARPRAGLCSGRASVCQGRGRSCPGAGAGAEGGSRGAHPAGASRSEEAEISLLVST